MSSFKTDIIPFLDITGNFKKITNNSKNMEERLLYNELITLINMKQGFHPWYPDLGLANIIARFPFSSKSEAAEVMEELETQVSLQLGSECVTNFKINTDTDGSSYVLIDFKLQGLSDVVTVKYKQNDPNITIVDPSGISDLHSGGIL